MLEIKIIDISYTHKPKDGSQPGWTAVYYQKSLTKNPREMGAYYGEKALAVSETPTLDELIDSAKAVEFNNIRGWALSVSFEGAEITISPNGQAISTEGLDQISFNGMARVDR